MDCIGKPITFKLKRENWHSPDQLEPKTGIIESFYVKLDKPRYAIGYGSNQYDKTHEIVGGPGNKFEVVTVSGGKRKMRKSTTRKGRKQSKKTRKVSH